jgi:hypothetical protein
MTSTAKWSGRSTGTSDAHGRLTQERNTREHQHGDHANRLKPGHPNYREHYQRRPVLLKHLLRSFPALGLSTWRYRTGIFGGHERRSPCNRQRPRGADDGAEREYQDQPEMPVRGILGSCSAHLRRARRVHDRIHAASSMVEPGRVELPALARTLEPPLRDDAVPLTMKPPKPAGLKCPNLDLAIRAEQGSIEWLIGQDDPTFQPTMWIRLPTYLTQACPR